MPVETSLNSNKSDLDFSALLEQSFVGNEFARGDVIIGTVLMADSQGLIVGVGSCLDGFVSRKDIERLGTQPESFSPGQEIEVVVLGTDDDEGNFVLSVSQALQYQDWKEAARHLEADLLWEGPVVDANRGGLILQFGNLRGFVPASHVSDMPRGIEDEERAAHLSRYVGRKIKVKTLEVDRKARRLVFSQREAERGHRDAMKRSLLQKLKEGDVRTGVVNGMRDFGAFVDLGGADGLIHISELAWHRVKHPREVLEIGDEIQVYVLNLDEEGKRIALSLKRLQPNPWEIIDELYHVGQLVEGVVSRTANFGAFVSLKPGIEALLHVSQISDPSPDDVSRLISEGQKLLLRVISIESDQQRMGLSLKEVTSEEKLDWAERSNGGLLPQVMVDEANADTL